MIFQIRSKIHKGNVLSLPQCPLGGHSDENTPLEIFRQAY